MAIENRFGGLRYDVVSVSECENPELLMEQLNREFVRYLHYIIYNFKVILKKKDLSVTYDLTMNSSHIPISIAINDSLTKEMIFIGNQNPEQLIEEFVAELVTQQEIVFDDVVKMYPMVDKDSLPKHVQTAWSNWMSQIPIFGFNSEKYNLHMVKYYFVKTISVLSKVKVAKKDNLYMFLITP